MDVEGKSNLTCEFKGTVFVFIKFERETNNVMILLDFTENYSYITQDVVQGCHWNSSQTTLHSLGVHYGDENDDQLKIINCVFFCLPETQCWHSAFFSICFNHLKKRENIWCTFPIKN